jgi:hypothetical protein
MSDGQQILQLILEHLQRWRPLRVEWLLGTKRRAMDIIFRHQKCRIMRRLCQILAPRLAPQVVMAQVQAVVRSAISKSRIKFKESVLKCLAGR